MRVVGLVGLVLALGVGYFIFQRSVSGPGQQPPQAQIDVVAIGQQLLSIGQAERRYLAARLHLQRDRDRQRGIPDHRDANRPGPGWMANA